MPLTARFQLVENALNDLHQVTFCNITAFCHRQIWQDLRFYCILVQYFVHARSVYLGFYSTKIKDNRLLSICRDLKSLDDFYVKYFSWTLVFLFHQLSTLLLHLLQQSQILMSSAGNLLNNSFLLSLCKYTFLLIILNQNPKLNWSSSCALLFDNIQGIQSLYLRSFQII